MRILLICLCLLAGCDKTPVERAHAAVPTPSVWQEGLKGRFYGPSPFFLWPSGIGGAYVPVTLPNSIAFERGSASLDPNGQVIAALQAQRASELRNYDALLICQWSAQEAAELGPIAAGKLAAARCSAVTDLYHRLDSRIHVTVALREASDAVAIEGAEAFAQLSLAPSDRTLIGPDVRVYDRMVELFDPYRDYLASLRADKIYVPLKLEFPPDSAALSPNARSLLTVIAEASRPTQFIQDSVPGRPNLVLINCWQNEGEGGTAPADTSLARRRCETVRNFLIDYGICEHRAFFGDSSVWIFEGEEREWNVRFDIFESKTSATGKEC